MTGRHGENVTYTLHGCRCTPCTDAHTAYDRDRRRLIAYGQWQSYVEAGPARDHVRALMSYGIAWQRVAAAADVSPGVVSRILYGRTGHPPAAKLTSAASAKLLAVEPVFDLVGDLCRIDASGVRRRLQALVAIGWTQSALADLLGMHPTNFRLLLLGETVAAGRARMVFALYESLWDQVPPQTTRADQIAVKRARNYAQSRGWRVPLEWDDDLIDVPDDVLDAELRARVAALPDVELLRICGAYWKRGERTLYTAAAMRERGARQRAKPAVA